MIGGLEKRNETELMASRPETTFSATHNIGVIKWILVIKLELLDTRAFFYVIHVRAESHPCMLRVRF